ncbi:MAG: hypothetical protein WC373_12590 [Smithella sp.]
MITHSPFCGAEATPVCGEDFCEVCGDCLACYGEDPCQDGGKHVWIRHENEAVEGASSRAHEKQKRVSDYTRKLNTR